MKIRADRRVGLLLGGVLLSTFVSIVTTVVLPAADPSLDEKGDELSSEASKGLEIYRSQGLWQCNAAYVRETSIDGAATGRSATLPQDIEGVAPAMLGLERVVPASADAQVIADACGVQLSEPDVAAVGAFLATRAG